MQSLVLTSMCLGLCFLMRRGLPTCFIVKLHVDILLCCHKLASKVTAWLATSFLGRQKVWDIDALSQFTWRLTHILHLKSRLAWPFCSAYMGDYRFCSEIKTNLEKQSKMLGNGRRVVNTTRRPWEKHANSLTAPAMVKLMSRARRSCTSYELQHQWEQCNDLEKNYLIYIKDYCGNW